MWDFKFCPILEVKRRCNIFKPLHHHFPSIGAGANETTERLTPATIQAGAALLEANSKQALAVVKRKILYIVLFCFVLF